MITLIKQGANIDAWQSGNRISKDVHVGFIRCEKYPQASIDRILIIQLEQQTVLKENISSKMRIERLECLEFYMY